jgi:formylglycine-generating enzyme required for sulfatase activity
MRPRNCCYLAFLFLLLPVRSNGLFGQEPERAKGQRFALLVGVRSYKTSEFTPLEFTENDVGSLATILRDAGYRRVVVLTQMESHRRGNADLAPTGRNIRDHLDSLLEDRKPEDTVLVAFSGHGVQFKEDSDHYFCPMDAQIKEPSTLVSLREVYRKLERNQAGLKVLFVDACRDNPLPRGAKFAVAINPRPQPQRVQPEGGVAALFSCAEGQVSYESPKLQHGVFFHFLLEGLRGKAADSKGQVDLLALSRYVQEQVPEFVKDDHRELARQTPQLVGKLSGPAPLVTAATAAREKIKNSLGLELVLVPAGRFRMGSPSTEAGREDDEPQHDVEITRPFYVATTAVTRGQFRAFVEAEKFQTDAERQGGRAMDLSTLKYRADRRFTWKSPGFDQTDEHPVVMVSWHDAVAFCRWLSKKEGVEYRLPTEAEREYFARAGTTTRYWHGEDEAGLQRVANTADEAFRALAPDARWTLPWNDGFAFTSPVGKFRANPWGLYDVHGNVWEWCSDWSGADYYRTSPLRDPPGPASGKYKIIRGGSFLNGAKAARSAHRWGCDPRTEPSDNMGFRVVRVK